MLVSGAAKDIFHGDEDVGRAFPDGVISIPHISSLVGHAQDRRQDRRLPANVGFLREIRAFAYAAQQSLKVRVEPSHPFLVCIGYLG
jgi:hypothetical protein